MQALKVQGRLLKMFPKLCAGCREIVPAGLHHQCCLLRLYCGLHTVVSVLSGTLDDGHGYYQIEWCTRPF